VPVAITELAYVWGALVEQVIIIKNAPPPHRLVILFGKWEDAILARDHSRFSAFFMEYVTIIR
jgi:hypothetical protein